MSHTIIDTKIFLNNSSRINTNSHGSRRYKQNEGVENDAPGPGILSGDVIGARWKSRRCR